MALSSSDFLYLDLTTAAFISHLRENTTCEVTREPRTGGSRGILRPLRRGGSRHTTRVGNDRLPRPGSPAPPPPPACLPRPTFGRARALASCRSGRASAPPR